MSERFGAYQLDSLIAVGGMGELWRARRDDPAAARDEPEVALKRMHTHLVRNDLARAQFAIEQQLATALPRHRGVVHARDVGVVEGRPYVALELARGQDLRRTLAAPIGATGATVVLPRAGAIAIVAAAADAAAHLHRYGWVHGDIHPGNLVVDLTADDADRVVLIDLGVARKLGEAGAVRGTPAYMAPEQVRGGAWTAATDVFALGVLLWELVAAERLFYRGPPWLSQAAVVEHAPARLADPKLDAIAQAALAKAPADRTASAAELAASLRSV